MILSLAAIGAPFIPSWVELRPFVAELTLICTTVAVLLTPFFTKKSNVACALVTLVGLAVALLSLLMVGPDAGQQIQRFAPMLVADPISFLWKILLLLFVIGIVMMWF